MLSRFISRSFNLRSLTLTLTSISSPIPPSRSSPSSNLRRAIPFPTSIFPPSRAFSSDDNRSGGNGDDRGPSSTPQSWTLTPDDDDSSIFGSGESDLPGITDDAGSVVDGDGGYKVELKEEEEGGDIFEAIDKEVASKRENGDEWETAEGYEPWTLGEEEKEVFESGGGGGMEGLSAIEGDVAATDEDSKNLEEEKQGLSATLKGPNRAFGDLIAASGITEAMLDSLIALKDLEGVEGLPPLREIEDMRLEKNERKSTRYEMEQRKQEEIAKSHVRQVDEKGRAYGTGRRKCSIARVWIQPGDGKFIVNDKEFDAYFPNIDHRANLLRPFSETKTLGLWDVHCTVKGGGISGQAGAIRLGVSRALQNWEPGLRPPLRAAGFLTRDPRVVERKKPGKAKARKSFQWVKR